MPADVFPDEPCADCGKKWPARLSWSPAYRVWLCTDCRGIRTTTELSATEQANAKAALAAHLAAGRAAGDR